MSEIPVDIFFENFIIIAFQKYKLPIHFGKAVIDFTAKENLEIWRVIYSFASSEYKEHDFENLTKNIFLKRKSHPEFKEDYDLLFTNKKKLANLPEDSYLQFPLKKSNYFFLFSIKNGFKFW